MMTKIKKSIMLGVAALGCSTFALAGVCVSDNGEVAAPKAARLITAQEIFSQYDLGQEFSVPEATISYEGESYAATSTLLYFPNGTPYTSDKLTLNALGEYTLVYQTVVDGEKISVSKTFVVNDFPYTVGPNSVLEYSDSLDRITSDSVAGLHLGLADKDVFTYNGVINIYDYDMDTPLLRMHPYSNGGNGTTYRESLKQVVRLTDCYDPENFIEFELCWDYSNHITQTAAAYYRADVAGKKSVGIKPVEADKVVKSAIYIGDTRYEVRNGTYGAFTNTWQLTDKGVTVYFDPITNCFYAEDNSKTLVSDVDNVGLYGEYAFKGFTTGEVYVSVLAEEYYTGTVNIDISLLAGMEESQLHLNKVYDRKAPDIRVDVASTEKIYYVAKNESIAIPKATAYDVNLNGEITVGVYSQYGTAKQRQHSSKNGIFTPKSEGLYTIVYTAKDTYGNTATEKITLNCIYTANDQIVSVTMPQAEGLTAGRVCQLPAFEALSRNGEVAVSAYYRFAGEEQMVEIFGNAFFVENVGEYEIIYEYSDVFTSYTASYKVSSVPSSNVNFSKPVLPNYMIAGAPYTLEHAYAYTYENQKPTQREVEVYLVGEDGEDTLIDDIHFVVPDCKKVQFKYSYGGISVYSEEIPVVNVGFDDELRMQDYFVGNFVNSADYNGVYYQSKVNSGDNTLEFVNVLSLSNFSFAFNVAEGWDNFEALDVVLTDYYDRSNSVTVSYLKKAETTYFVCGNEQADVIVPFVGSHKFFYQARTNVFMEMSSKSVACPNAFTSDKVLLTVRVRTIDGAAKIGITEVGGQILSNDPVDYFKPKMLIEDDGGVKTLGDKITIKMPTIIDVLSPYAQANLTLTVRKPSKGYATSDDGITLQAGCPVDREYTVSLTEDGAYKVTFQYVDAGGNSITDGFTADVLDMEGPTIVLNDGYNASTVVTATLNTKVTLQGYTVSDNKSAADKLTVRCLVYSPNLEQLFVVNNQFEATRKGMYTVYYYAYDEAGNYSVASYRVYVG